MKLNILHNLEIMQDYDAYVIPFFSSTLLNDFFDEEFCELITPYLETGIFKAKKGETYSFTSFFKGTKKYINIIFVGFGDESSVDTEVIMNGFGKAVTVLQTLKSKKPLIFMENISEVINKVDPFLKACKAMQLANYTFEKYQTKKDFTWEVKKIDLFSTYYEAERCVKRSEMFAQNTIFARELVNEPANMLKPVNLAEKASEFLAKTGIDVKVYDKNEIIKLGMKAFMSVAQGSEAEPKLIVMNYMGNPESEEKLALVGKGLTYDSGGYSIKPTDGMMSMKTDMAGSAAVIGAIKSIAESKMKINAVAIVAACENMISGRAYLPGDVIGSMNGKFIEVVNTDAEGRLTLADAITFAIRKENATHIVDVATLTGAAVVALGEDYAGIVTNSDDMYKKIEKASMMSNEKIWRMPLDDNIRDKNKSTIGDIKNSGGRTAGCSSAGAFIEAFTEDMPWIHMDIAGTADTEKDLPYCRKGGTGYGVELLFDLASQLK